MAHVKNTKLKLPLTLADIQAMEDKASEIAQIFRGIRARMTEKRLDSVELKPGSFNHYIALAKQNMIAFPGELEKQIYIRDEKAERLAAKASVAEVREQQKRKRKSTQ